jgi:hypothetical protein
VYLVRYNLQLLKAMLEEKSGSSGLVDLATYSHVIRLWVKDVRDRSNQQPSLEVSQISSDSEEEEDCVSTTTPRPQLSFAGDQSFETSGGNSSTHSAHESVDVLASLEDMRLENRRLLEKERQLEANLDQSEEQLRALQTENSSLLSQLQSMQQELLKVEVVEREKSSISQSLREEEGRCQLLQESAEKMRLELNEARREVEGLRQSLKEGEEEREKELQETAGLHERLADREVSLWPQYLVTFHPGDQVTLGEDRQRREQLAEQLAELTAAQNSLRSKVAELEEGNAVLRRENEELHSAALSPGPSYSTPYRPSATPSLHEEISRRGNLSDRALQSPLVGVDHRHSNKKECGRLEDSYDNSDPSLSYSHSNLSLEDLEHIARSSSNKFHSKTEMIVRLLSELMPSSSPPSSSQLTSLSSDSITEVSKNSRQGGGNMRQLVTCVKRLYRDKKQLKAQVEELQVRLQELSERDEADAAVQTQATPPRAETTPPLTAVATPMTDNTVQRHRPLASCSRFVGGVVRGVVWALYLSLLLLLLCTILVWLHQHLTPCCRGNGPLTPGGMVWALLEPHVTVSHHGHI